MARSQHSTSLHDTSMLSSLKLAKVAIVHTEWNDKIVQELLNGCEGTIHEFGGDIVAKLAVPGCFELAFGCRMLWEHCQKKNELPEAIIAFGAVIRGGTPHFDYVCQSVTEGITQLNLSLPVPVIFGVLTLDDEAQAWERLGGTHGHKGEEAAVTALKMIAQARKLNGTGH
ncbi:MAG: 6,7-dimethyl-8-ribityllumazine synthase [Bacteroidetes bacterium 46-16]|nr:MAG: 6,7-dimethyl-8-ribityllumazine synthase [Bacteroidetes bacterium 46-16]